jgi:hypothetical protein
MDHEDRLAKLAAFQLMMIKHAMKCPLFIKPQAPSNNSNASLQFLQYRKLYIQHAASTRQKTNMLSVKR